MIRVSVTALDGFEFYQNSDFLSQHQYLREVFRLDPPTPAMQAGIEFEAWLENQIKGKPDDSWTVNPALEINIPRVVAFQVGVVKEYDMLGRTVILSGRTDGMHGHIIDDWKTTSKPLTYGYEKVAERYAWQWRSYLTMLGCDQFQFHVFHIDAVKKKVLDYLMCPFDSYPGMREEVESKVREYAGVLVEFERQGLIVFDKNGRLKPGPEFRKDP